ELVGWQRLADLVKAPVRVLDAVGVLVEVNDSEVRLHRTGREEDRGVRVRKIVIDPEPAPEICLMASGQVVAESETGSDVVRVVLQDASFSSLEVPEIRLVVGRLGRKVLPDRVRSLVEVETGPQVVA